MGLNLPLDMGIPDSPFPTEGQDETTSAGAEANAKANFYGSWGGLGIARTMQQFAGGQRIPHDEAAKALTDQGYDAAGVPKDGWTSGALQIEMNRQSLIKRNQDIANRSHMGGVTRFVSGLAGGFADPANLALLPLSGPLAGAGKSIGARLVVGGAVGAAYTGAADISSNAMLGHNEDDLTYNTLRDIVWGTAIGGGLHATFGGRAPKIEQRIEPGPMTLDGISALERSGAAARRMGVPINEVTSDAGAIGEYQIMPDTARQYGFDPAQLKDPVYAKRAAQKILDALNTHFKGDGEAVAVAWNAGPGRAARWLAAGKDDSLLPAETRDYLARYRAANGARIIPQGDTSQAVEDLPPEVRENAAKTAAIQLANDSPVNVQPVIEAGMAERAERNGPRSALTIRDEHDAEVSRLTTEGMKAAVPEQAKNFETDPEELNKRVPPVQPQPEPEPGAAMGPKEAELTEHLNDAVKDAKSLGAVAGEEHEEFSFDKLMEKGNEDKGATEEFTKAMEAAIQCGNSRGVV